MHQNPQQLNSTFQESLKSQFKSDFILKGLNLIKSSQVKIDYTRGGPEKSYYIVSGAVIENQEHIANLKSKRDDESSNRVLTSSCDCIHWTKDDHCQHIAALYMKYQLQIASLNPEELLEDRSIQSKVLSQDFGATPREYGTIIGQASELKGVARNLGFNSCQYFLKNSKVNNYPQSKTFNGKLNIELKIIEIYKSEQNSEQDVYQWVQPRFSYQNEKGQYFYEVSIFEHTHIFDWSNGDLYQLDGELRDLVRKIRYLSLPLEINDYLRMCQNLIQQGKVELSTNGNIFDLENAFSPLPRIMIQPAQKKNQVEVNLDFVSEQGDKFSLPSSLSVFTFEGGLLSSFKKKQDAYKLIESIVTGFKEERFDYSQFLRPSKERELFNQIITSFTSDNDEFIWDANSNTLCKYDKNALKTLFICFFDHFGELFYRFSSFNVENQICRYEAATALVLQGMSDFYQKVSIFGTQIFYDRAEIARWSSRIKFERKSTKMNWFELELNINKDDLDLILKADLDNGFAVTSKGLVLLTQDQKELIRFMKRYTMFDKQDEQTNPEDQSKKFILPFNKARIFELFELRRLGIDGALTDEEIQLCEKLMTLKEIPEYDIPEIKDFEPRPYQVTGYNWLRFLYENNLGACLADDMGLGKTLQAIMFLTAVQEQFNRALIICPVSIIMNWEKEFEKFSDLPVHIYYGNDRVFDPKAKIVLTSYGVMKKEHEEVFGQNPIDILVLDEVQHLKNLRSLGAIAARNLKAKFRICLTGTPVENDLSEFYNILDLSIPGIWGDLQFVRTASTKKSRLLARKTAKPFILRRTKAQVLTDLPEKTEDNVPILFSDTERNNYVKHLELIKHKLKSVNPRKRYGEVLKGLLELRQMCLWQKKPELESTKIEKLVETLEQIHEEGHQAIIFSQFTTYLDLIQTEFDKKLWKYSRIDGSKSFKRRQKDVDEFQSGKNPFFLISLKAGGVGLNLTAASYVFLMDPWWNPAVESQAIDRAHRIGQKNKLTVYRYIIQDSVEEKVLKFQEIKKELFQDLMADNDDSYFTGKLTMNDFESFFN